MAIRYDSQLKAEIRKAVKSFNAKIRRLEAKGVTAALLPSLVSTKEIRAGITNKRDLRKRLKQLADFSSAGTVETTEAGLVGTNILFQYRQAEANKAIQQINKEYEKVLNLNTRYPMMQGEFASNLQAKMEYLSRDIKSLDIRQVQIFNKNILTPEKINIKNEQFYQNFNRMLFFNAYKSGISPTLMNSILTKIEQLPPSRLLELYSTNPAFASVKDVYMKGKAEAGELSDEEAREQLEALDESLSEEISKM